MTLRYSDDGVNYGATLVRSLTAAERIGADNSDGMFEVVTSARSGRFVELSLNQGIENRWLALGEVSFEGTPGALAPGSVPEPGTVALVGLALAGLAGAKRSRRPLQR